MIAKLPHAYCKKHDAPKLGKQYSHGAFLGLKSPANMPPFAPVDLSRWSGGAWQHMPRLPVTGASINTRTLQPGELFFALPGAQADGHAYVADALARGAAGAVVHADFAAAHPAWPLLRVADPAAALRAIAAGYRTTLSAQFIAVTGSVGKTTVKEMTADLLATVGPTARTRGNFNNDLGLPLSLLAMEPMAEFGVFELGMNHPGELAPLCKLLRPAIGIVTTIGPVHLEFFGSVQAIAEEKAEVLRALPADGLAVLDADGLWFEFLRNAAPCRVVTPALQAAADFVGQPDPARPGAFTVCERASGATMAMMNSVPGAHNIRNALLALAAARLRGAAWGSMRAVLARFQPIGLRWQRSEWAGVTTINDAYNASPPSMRAALATFAEMTVSGRRWLVLGGMRELGRTTAAEHHALGSELATGLWAGLVTVGPLGTLIAAGAAAAGMAAEKIFQCADCSAAVATLRAQLQPGDAVLVKASRGEKLERVIDDLTKGIGSA